MENQNNSRRSFIRKVALGGMMAISIPEILSASLSEKGSKKVQLMKDNVVLFQGDSITDAGRIKEDMSFNNARALGSGYAMLAAADLLEEHASLNLKIYNKGISGNKVYQLAERWEKDCLEIKPDVLSILIGVNDFWHTLDFGYNGTVQKYEQDYRQLLTDTKKAFPEIQLVICEPFAVLGCKAVTEKWYPTFNEYRVSAKKLAIEFDAIFIPYQSIFDEAQKHAPGIYWTGDGVHPSMAGCSLMAEAWLKALK